MAGRATSGKHLVFGPDGNRRYAVNRQIPYEAAYGLLPDRLRAVSERCFDEHELGSVTIWLLQEYNLLRDRGTATALADTALRCVERMAGSTSLIGVAHGVELVGELETLDAVSPGIVGELEAIVRDSRTGSAAPRLRVLLAYNADKELGRALDRCAADGVGPTFGAIAQRWSIPPVDLLVRTGQAKGVANLSSYWPGLERGRILTTEVLPQDFDREALDATLRTYATAVDSVRKLVQARERDALRSRSAV